MSNSLLIIEDEALLASELARYFGKTGWEVSIADSLHQAEDQLLNGALDPLVVVSDMNPQPARDGKVHHSGSAEPHRCQRHRRRSYAWYHPGNLALPGAEISFEG